MTVILIRICTSLIFFVTYDLMRACMSATAAILEIANNVFFISSISQKVTSKLDELLVLC